MTLPFRSAFEADADDFVARWEGKSAVYNKKYGAQCVQLKKKRDQEMGAPIGKGGNAHEMPESIAKYSPKWWAWHQRHYDVWPASQINYGDPLPKGSWAIWSAYPGNSTGHIAMFLGWEPNNHIRVFDQWRQDNEFDEDGVAVKLGVAKISIQTCNHLKAFLIPQLRPDPEPPAEPTVAPQPAPVRVEPAQAPSAFINPPPAPQTASTRVVYVNQVSKARDRFNRWIGKYLGGATVGGFSLKGVAGGIEHHFEHLSNQAFFIELGIIAVITGLIGLIAWRAYRQVKHNPNPNKFAVWVFNKLKGKARMEYKKQIGDTEMFDKLTANLTLGGPQG